LGEGLPFWFFRIDFYWLKPWVAPELAPKAKKKPSEYVMNNFLFTSSGMQYLPAFMCAYMAVGADNIAFGADPPFESSKETIDKLGELPICRPDKEKFFHGNAERLFKIK
jgi:2,3-dihydroxybenzoate decarboxylase